MGGREREGVRVWAQVGEDQGAENRKDRKETDGEQEGW